MDQFYEEIEQTFKWDNPQFLYITGVFNARVGKKNVDEFFIGNFGIGEKMTEARFLLNFQKECETD